MKIALGKRILMFLHWLFSLMFTALLVVSFLRPAWITTLREYGTKLVRGETNLLIAAGAILLIYLLLCVVQVLMIFSGKNKAERNYITVDSGDGGRVRIAISAIEQMIRQSVNNIEGIADMKIAIENADDAIAISINASIFAGTHVPTITVNMQQSIRKFIEVNCGVGVRAVSININTVINPTENGKQRKLKKSQSPAYEAPVMASEPASVPEPIAFHEPDLVLEKTEEANAEQPIEE